MSWSSAVFAVWRRYLAVFRKNVVYAMITTFCEPLLYLFSFGFGLGAIIGDLHTNGLSVKYRAFVLAGIVSQALLFQGFFEAAYGSFIRMYYQRIFQAISVTPVTLSEVLWGELFWDASRATISASAVLLMGVIIGDFSPWGALAMVPLCFVFGLIFGSLGLLTAAKSRTIESISYPQYLLIFPMFLFCGVFFPVEQLPEWLRPLIWIFPLTPVLSIIRSLVLGFPFQFWAPLAVIFWLAVLIPIARRAMTKRLIS